MKTKIVVWLFVLVSSCSGTKTALFDHYSYQKTTEIKVVTGLLLDKSILSFESHQEEVQQLRLEIMKLTEYEKNKPNNEITWALWQMMNDANRNLLEGYLVQWEKKKTLSPSFKEEGKKQIMEAFDLLIQYEIKKDQNSKNQLESFISKIK